MWKQVPDLRRVILLSWGEGWYMLRNANPLYGCCSKMPILRCKTMDRHLPATAITELKLLTLSFIANKLLEISGKLINF